MTEVEWLKGIDPTPMLKVVQTHQRRRKLRLLCCACCRRLWTLLPQASQQGVEAAERFADGLASRGELEAARAQASGVVLALPRVWSYDVLRDRYATSSAADCGATSAATANGALSITSSVARAASLTAAGDDRSGTLGSTRDLTQSVELAAQAELVRDILGNPFRPMAFDPAWRTDDVVLLSRGMYESRDFSPMPILADAIQDAGCDDDELLNHCRAPVPHARGCWVVDLVLGKV